MHRVFKTVCIAIILSLLCACKSGVDDERTLNEALQEPVAFWVKAEKRIYSDKVIRETVVFDINSESELNKLTEEYKLRISKNIDFDFNKAFFKKNKLYLVIRDRVSVATYGEMHSFIVDGDSLHIAFQYLATPIVQDSTTCGYLVAVSRESVKDITDVDKITVVYFFPDESEEK